MRQIVEIVPSRPGWYARWRTAGGTRCYPISLWALVEEADGSGREVIGVDCAGQWPGADDLDAEVEFVRYLFHAVDTGTPEDAEPPSTRAGFRRQPATTT
ncbi:hypothetical protein ABT336_22310 [Micromonospora sp. NPDC000207]|uniref:hypothetical protein n=1 Tax=Micromonospora sp. NPDC000207 TaxID=3154246 RepID=UPI0033220DBE